MQTNQLHDFRRYNAQLVATQCQLLEFGETVQKTSGQLLQIHSRHTQVMNVIKARRQYR
ncbi:hypothetical protein D3C77_684550 [compost metagenome]